MRRSSIRQISIGAVVVLVAAAVSGAAFAARSHGRFVALRGVHAGGFLGQPGGFLGGGFAMGGPGRGFGGPGGFGPGRGFAGAGAGGSILAADILTPAASCLGLSSASALASDLSGGKTLAQEATSKGPSNCNTADELVAAIVKSETAVLDNEKTAGWITADQETALVGQLTTQITSIVNDGPPVPRTASNGGGFLQLASAYLNISVSDLQADLKAGKSLASLISGSLTVDGLIAALEAPAKANLDSAVTAKKITQAQEDAILSKMTAGLTKLVNGTANTSQSNTVKKNLRKFAVLKTFAKRK